MRQPLALILLASLFAIGVGSAEAQLRSGVQPSYGGAQQQGGGVSGIRGGGYGGFGGGYGGYGGGYGGYGGYGAYGVPNYGGRPLGTFGNIGNPAGAGAYNNPYYGSYGPIGAPGGAPVLYGSPVAAPGGYFRIGRVGVNFWQSPSGYYYPWGLGAAGAPQTVYYVQEGSTTQAKPPIPTMLNDMEKYLSQSKEKGRVSQQDYQHIFRRMQDLRGKYSRLAAESDGLLDQADESSLRRDVDQLSSEVALRVKPASASADSPSPR